MNKLKVIEVKSDNIKFDNGMVLSAFHKDKTYADNYLCFDNLTLNDFKDLELVLTSGDNIVKKFEVSDNQEHTQWN